MILDTISGRNVGKGLQAVPSKKEALKQIKSLEFKPLDENRKEREMIIFRSFNLEKINK